MRRRARADWTRDRPETDRPARRGVHRRPGERGRRRSRAPTAPNDHARVVSRTVAPAWVTRLRYSDLHPPGKRTRDVKRDTPFTLVLGGGGMKGLAHIGVLQALGERGLTPTCVVGSSVGALVGAAWSAGHSPEALREIAITLKRRDVFVVAHAD